MPNNRSSEFHVADTPDGLPKIKGLKRRGLMLVLSSPSGAGKTTMSRSLLEIDEDVTLSISYTTRPQRPGEVDGKHYHFVSIPEFEKMAEDGAFLEHANYAGNWYGTPRQPVMDALAKGLDVLFDIDWQGTQQIAEQARDDLVTVFVFPPTWDELERRLRMRAQDTEEVIQRRLLEAHNEITHYYGYDYVIINRDIEDSMFKLRTVLGAERMRRQRLTGLSDFVRRLNKGENTRVD
jgi:guanylate kinase